MALCIDHGFRDGAAAEARQAQDWALALGLMATIVTHTGPMPKSGLQAHARALRHTSLSQAAAKMGGACVLLGHTRDDQAETVAFRLARKSGLDGLAAMASVTTRLLNWQGQAVPVARPLLGVGRGALRDYLSTVGQAWIEDPSNENCAFSRVKVRQRLAVLRQHERLARIADLAGRLRAAVDGAEAALASRALEGPQSEQGSYPVVGSNGSAQHELRTFPASAGPSDKDAQLVLRAPLARQMQQTRPSKGTHLDKAIFLDGPACAQARVLATQIQAQAHVPRPICPSKLQHLLEAMAGEGFSAATLGGAMIVNAGLSFHIVPAPPRRAPKQHARALVTELG
jgi:tRNA(Ile)-lysidine synthetase-like protein